MAACGSPPGCDRCTGRHCARGWRARAAASQDRRPARATRSRLRAGAGRERVQAAISVRTAERISPAPPARAAVSEAAIEAIKRGDVLDRCSQVVDFADHPVGLVGRGRRTRPRCGARTLRPGVEGGPATAARRARVRSIGSSRASSPRRPPSMASHRHSVANTKNAAPQRSTRSSVSSRWSCASRSSDETVTISLARNWSVRPAFQSDGIA